MYLYFISIFQIIDANERTPLLNPGNSDVDDHEIRG